MIWVPIGLAALLLLLLGIAVLRTLLAGHKVSTYRPQADGKRAAAYAQTLSRMVQVETVSDPAARQREKFLRFHALLEALFPLVHSHLEKTELDGSLLYHWKGQSDARPIVLMSHQDVVPAEGAWTHPPFSGEIADGKVWGRGSADTKCSVFAFFQAVEELLAQGFVPPQDVWLSSSCTEEFGGPGCQMLVDELKRRGVRPWLVCDEGGGIITDPIAGVPGSFAMMGVFEKGKADVKFTARSGGGHASAPPANSPIPRLAAFITRVEKHPPFRRQFGPEVRAMFTQLAPYGGFALRLLFGNIWLFGPLLKRVMPKLSAQASALLRTTAAFTMQRGSDACNVLPQEASVWANLRFIPHQGMDESLAILKTLSARYGLEMEVLSAGDYTKPTDIHGAGWQYAADTVRRTFPGLPVCPYVMTGATDARFYQQICDNVIRFAPVIYGPEQMKGMHGVDENLGVDCLPGAVDFYKNLILDLQ